MEKNLLNYFEEAREHLEALQELAKKHDIEPSIIVFKEFISVFAKTDEINDVITNISRVRDEKYTITRNGENEEELN